MLDRGCLMRMDVDFHFRCDLDLYKNANNVLLFFLLPRSVSIPSTGQAVVSQQPRRYLSFLSTGHALEFLSAYQSSEACRLTTARCKFAVHQGLEADVSRYGC